MVGVYTIEGDIRLNTKPFESSIAKVTAELERLSTLDLQFSSSKAMGELETLKKVFIDIGAEAKKISEAFSQIKGLNTFLGELESIIGKMETLKGLMANFKTDVNETVTKVQALNNEFTNMRYYIDLAKAEMTGLLQLQKESESLEKQKRMDALTNRQTLLSEAYYHNMEQQEKVQIQLQQEMIERLQRVGQERMKNLEMAQRELSYMEQQHQAETLLYDDIIKRYETQGKLATTVQEQLGILAERNATEEEEIAFLDNQLMLQKSINTLISQGGAENIKSAEALIKQLDADNEITLILERELNLEKQKLATIEEENALLKKQTAEREKGASASAKGNQMDKMGYLPRRIGSMALTMWGFNEIMDIYEKSMQNMNAIGQQKAYTDLMKTDNRYLEQTNQNVTDITSGINKMNKAINESYKGGMSLQKMYQKVDMQSVGANAMDSAFKYGVQADKLDELTEVMAIYGSEFVRQGRSQEDSILAVNDALDGEYRRLKEVNIGKEELEAHGYEEGDTLSMIKALREIAQERGYDVVAQKVTNLSDAITVLEIRIAQDLVGAFKILEPILTEVANDFIYMLDTFEWAFGGVRDIWNDFTTELDKTFGVQNVQKFGGGLLKIVGWAITLGITFGVVYKVVKGLKGMLGGLFDVIGKGTDDVAKTTGDVAKTGGTVDSGGGFKDNFMKQWGKLGKDLGKIARAFIDVAVIMFGAFALIEEAILLISAIGYTYESLKPQFESGIDFIKEYGLMIALLGGALVGLAYIVGKVPDSAMEQVGKGALKVAFGIFIGMTLVAEAILLLAEPLIAIEMLGYIMNDLSSTAIQKGMDVIGMFGNALDYIANNGNIALFLVALTVLSGILGATADTVAIPMALGIFATLTLVAEAIILLAEPLIAIESLGYIANDLDSNMVQQGAEAIRIVGECLTVLEPSIRDLLAVDLEVFADNLVNLGNKLITGKTGLESLTDNILPSLVSFVKDFNELEMPTDGVNTEKVAMVTQMATDLPPLFTAMQDLNNAMGTSDIVGNVVGGVGGTLSTGIGMGLKGKLDQLYNDVRDVMDFATKLGGLQGENGADATALTQTANAIQLLKAKLDVLVTTISTSATRVQEASKKLGSAIKTGFESGSSGFNTSVVTVLASGISEVQQRYDTWKSGGETSAQKLASGFETISDKFKSTISAEMGYALDELNNYTDDFYAKGKTLGEELTRGFRDGMDFHSPALISRTIAQEMEYSMLALDKGKQMMYSGGVALGQALVNGYQNYGNLRTDVGVLASKGVSSEQLQANAKSVQVNGKKNQQAPQSLNPTINIDMSNSIVYGIQDLDAKIQGAVEKAIVKINSPNGAIGY